MENTVTFKFADPPKWRTCISCLVCGESVELTEMEESRLMCGMSVHSKICDKCKAAILYMREQMLQNP